MPQAKPVGKVKLKPCPFCRSAHVEMRLDYAVTCRACGARGPLWVGSVKGTPEARWNTRKESP